MKKLVSGDVFGRLTVIARSSKPKKWDCLCACGRMVSVAGYSLKRKNTGSCGCLRSEMVINKNTTHGMSSTSEFDIWCNMKARCENKNNPNYHNYGGRGINVSDEWHTFQTFINDMGLRPSKKHSVERKNNDLGYCKSNCEWATPKEQTRNSRRNVCVIYNKESFRTISALAEKLSIPYNVLYPLIRTRKPCSVEEAVSRAYQLLTTKGKSHEKV